MLTFWQTSLEAHYSTTGMPTEGTSPSWPCLNVERKPIITVLTSKRAVVSIKLQWYFGSFHAMRCFAMQCFIFFYFSFGMCIGFVFGMLDL